MIQNTRIALAPYQAEYQFLTSNDAFTVFGMIHQDQIHFRFFIKNCLWAGMGSTRYLNLIPKIQNLFGGRLLVFCCDGRFLLNHSRSICGFFRSIDLRNTGPIVPLIHFESCAPAWPLAFKKSSCCEKVISGFSGRSHPARSGRVLQLP